MDKDFLLFSTEDVNHYLYDANTNTVHPLPCQLSEGWVKKIYDTPKGQALPNAEEIQAHHKNILNYFEVWRTRTDAFQRSPKEERLHLDSRREAQRMQSVSSLPCDMILVVTEQCNMRCAYCVYEKDLYDNRRDHNSTWMDKATARKAVDLYFDENKKDMYKPHAGRAMNLVFYGGEPLLNWEVVSDTAAYAREHHDGTFPMYMGMTSNLTLLKKEWLPFLRDHDFFIHVSLDGPKEEHDRYRHFADGSPTFDVVYRNLEMIRDFDETYFRRNVKAAVTCNGNTCFERLVDFFDNDPVGLKIHTVSELKDLETGKFHQIYPYDKKKQLHSKLALQESYIRQLQDKKGIPQGSALYSLIYEAQSIHFHIPHNVSGYRGWYTGACMPGRKLVVRPDGKIYPCERIAMDYPVGHVDNGIDEERLLLYFNRFFASTDRCGDCWARCRCGLCPAAVDSRGELEFENKCDESRKAIRSALISEYTQLEKTPDMFAGEFTYY